MKSTFSFVFALFLLASVGFAQKSAERAVLDTEARRFALMTKCDTIALASLLDGDLVYIHSNGLTETKAEHLRAIATGRLAYKSMQPEAVQVRRYGKMALTNGMLHATGVLNGTAFDLRLRYTAVYRRQGGNWKLLNWQSTRI